MTVSDEAMQRAQVATELARAIVDNPPVSFVEVAKMLAEELEKAYELGRAEGGCAICRQTMPSHVRPVPPCR